MRTSILIFLFLPFTLLSQENNVGTSTTKQKEGLINNVVFTSQGTLKFPDGTEQTTAYPGNNKQLGFLPSEFGITSQGGVKFPDNTIQTTAYIPNNNPPQSDLTSIVIEFGVSPGIGQVRGPAQGFLITDGLNNIISAREEVSIPVGFEGGGGGAGVGRPSFDEVTFTRQTDLNSAIMKGLLTTPEEISYIEVFYMKLIDNEYQIHQVARYENCYLTRYVADKFDSGAPVETVSFLFKKVCYRSYEYPQTGSPTQKESCYDLITIEGGCVCNF